MNFADSSVAASIVKVLRDKFRMTDAQFQSLHHRRNLKPSEGITAHLRYLEKVTALRRDQEQLARRLNACVKYMAGGDSWSVAARKAENDHPGAQSK